MKIKYLMLIAATFLTQISFAQNENLPVIKANSEMVDIKDDDVLKEKYWRIVPSDPLDVYTTSGKKVTFYTDMDSISFEINPEAGTYDFVILLNEKDSARTQIKYKKQKKGKITPAFDVYTIIATNKPANFDTRAINQSIRFSLTYQVPFGKSGFSLGFGAGVSFNNYYIDALPKDMLPVSMQPNEYGSDFYFMKINSITNPKISYKKNRMTLTYVDIPIELRYSGKKGFRVSAGAKIDYLVGSKIKYKGADFLFGTDKEIKIRKHNLEHLSNFQIGPVVRIGRNKINAYASYSFTPVYDTGAGSTLNPICAGISFTL